jgi:hypothetical protein
MIARDKVPKVNPAAWFVAILLIFYAHLLFALDPTYCVINLCPNTALNRAPFGRWTALKRRRLALR